MAARLVSGSSLWNVSQSEAQRTTSAPRGSSFVLDRIALSPDGKLIAGGGRDNAIKLWDAGTGRELFTLTGHRKSIRELAFSPDNKLLASASQDADIKLWSVATGQELKTLTAHSGGVIAIAFSFDGRRLASGSQDRTIVLWDVESGELDAAYNGHQEWVDAVAFSPDGKKLASGSVDGEIRIWEVPTRGPQREPQLIERPLKMLAGHKGGINALTFNSDGKLLVSGSSDASMKLWDVAAGRELASLFSLDQQDWLVVTPDGLFDGSPSSWNQILWRFSSNLFDVAPVEIFFNEFYHPGLLADLYAGKTTNSAAEYLAERSPPSNLKGGARRWAGGRKPNSLPHSQGEDRCGNGAGRRAGRAPLPQWSVGESMARRCVERAKSDNSGSQISQSSPAQTA